MSADYVNARVELLTTTLSEARQEASRAAAALERAEQSLKARADRLEKVASRYAAEPTEGNAAELIRARDARDVAEIPATAAKHELERRQESVRVAEVALDDARAAQDAQRRADEIADLHRLASTEHYAASTAMHDATILRAYSEIVAAAQAKDREFAASLAASAELRARGELSGDLGAHHLIGGLIAIAFKEHAERATAFLEVLDPRRSVGVNVVHQLSRGLAPLLRVPLLEQLGGTKASPQSPPLDAPEKLRAFFSGRTLTEALAASDIVGAKAEPVHIAPAPSGPPARYSIGAPPSPSSWATDDGAGAR